jgi:hypothetical protein
VRAKKDGVVWSEVDGNVVVLDLATAEYHSLNRTGTRLWLAVQEDTTADDLAEKLVAAYGIDLGHALKDVDRFLAEMVERDLIEP